MPWVFYLAVQLSCATWRHREATKTGICQMPYDLKAWFISVACPSLFHCSVNAVYLSFVYTENRNGLFKPILQSDQKKSSHFNRLRPLLHTRVIVDRLRRVRSFTGLHQRSRENDGVVNATAASVSSSSTPSCQPFSTDGVKRLTLPEKLFHLRRSASDRIRHHTRPNLLLGLWDKLDPNKERDQTNVMTSQFLPSKYPLMNSLSVSVGNTAFTGNEAIRVSRKTKLSDRLLLTICSAWMEIACSFIESCSLISIAHHGYSSRNEQKIFLNLCEKFRCICMTETGTLLTMTDESDKQANIIAIITLSAVFTV